MTDSSAQEHSFDAFGLTIQKGAHKDIRRLKRQHPEASLHGNKLWKSSLVLMDYLQESPIPKGASVLDVGCGWGLGGIYCAKQFGAHVVSMDADDSVFPFLLHHAELNGVTVEPWQNRFEKVTSKHLQQFDVVIGADVCFWDSMSKPIGNLINRAMKAGVYRTLFTDPGRPPFREMAEKIQKKHDSVYTDWDVPNPHNIWGLVLDTYNTTES